MALIDFPGEKLVIKLWETLADKGMGKLLTPGQIKREGRARNQVRREELLMLAQTEADANDIRCGRKRLAFDNSLELLPPSVQNQLAISDGTNQANINFGSVVDVAYQTQAIDAAKAEINVSKAILKAEEILASDSQEPPNRKPEEDWIFTWRNYVGHVSNEDLQQLWGQALAGEVKSPGSYSLRTLEFMKALSQAEAEQISKLARLAIDGRIFKIFPEFLTEQGITLDYLLGMQELGIVTGVESLGLSTTFSSDDSTSFVKVMRCNGKAIVIRQDDREKTLAIPVYLLTSIGKQILSLGSFAPNTGNLNQTGKWIANQGYEVSIGDWTQVTENAGNLSNAYPIDADSAGEAVKSTTESP